MASDAEYIIIEAETGSGKTVAVPQWFRSVGLSSMVTEPRIATVVETSEFVAQMMGEQIGQTIGYATGDNKVQSDDTEILYCTDGLALVRELNSGNGFDILIIDELHVWNTNQSTLEAWAWKHVLDGTSQFQKVIVLSATLDAAELSKRRGNAPIFKVPGRHFEIEERTAGKSMRDDIVTLVQEGHDVLAFVAGKGEINELIDALTEAEVNAELIPHHSKLSREEKRRAFASYSRPKVVVSTNALEDGQTMNPSDGRILAVVDSGMERRVGVEDGVEVLKLAPISIANGKQRRGRTGRTGKGIYIDHCPSATRTDYPVPEIQRSLLDQTVLRLRVAGYDATELPFFHEIDPAVLADAQKLLQALGYITVEGKVTKLGYQASKLPVGTKVARMILEAEKRGVLEDVLTIAAIWESGSLKARGDRQNTQPWRQITEEEESDALAELDLWNAARSMSTSQMQIAGVFSTNYYKAKDLRKKLVREIRRRLAIPKSSGDRTEILKSIAAGMVDHLYEFQGWGRYGAMYSNGEPGSRQLAKESSVRGGDKWVVGLPFDLEIQGRRGPFTINLITWVTKVDPEWLIEVAPQLQTTEYEHYRYNPRENLVQCDRVTVFNGQRVNVETIEATGEEAVKALAKALANQEVDLPVITANVELLDELQTLNTRYQGNVGVITTETLVAWYVEQLGEVCQPANIVEATITITDEVIGELIGVEDYTELRETVVTSRPDTWTIAGQSYDLSYIHAGRRIGQTPSRFGRGFGFRSNSFTGVEITLSIEVIAKLEATDFPQWDGVQVMVKVADDGYTNLSVTLPEKDLDYLRGEIEKSRLNKAWEEFKSSKGMNLYGSGSSVSHELTMNDGIPALPEAEVYDAVTGTLAYPYWSSSSFWGRPSAESKITVTLKWTRDKEEAEKKQATTVENKAKFDEKMAEFCEATRALQPVREGMAEVEELWETVEELKESESGMRFSRSYHCEALGIDSETYSTLGREVQSIRSELQRTSATDKVGEVQARVDELKAKLKAAQDYQARNAEAETQAQEKLDEAKAELAKVVTLQNGGWDDRRQYTQLSEKVETVEEAINSGKHLKAIQLVEAFMTEIAPMVAAEAEKLVKKQAEEAAAKLLETTIVTEYQTCPVTQADLGFTESDDYYHPDDNEAQMLDMVLGSSEGKHVLVQTKLNGQIWIKMVAEKDRGYWMIELVVETRTVKVGSKVETTVLVTRPSDKTLDHLRKTAEIRDQIAKIEDALKRAEGDTSYVRVEWESEEHRGKPQLRGLVEYTGSIRNTQKRIEAGQPESFEVTDEILIVVCNEHTIEWLDEKPQDSQEWLVQIGTCISNSGSIVVLGSPQIRIDQLGDLKIELELLDEDEESAEEEKPEVDLKSNGKPQGSGLTVVTSATPNAMEKAMIDAGLAVHKPAGE